MRRCVPLFCVRVCKGNAAVFAQTARSGAWIGKWYNMFIILQYSEHNLAVYLHGSHGGKNTRTRYLAYIYN